MDILGSLFVVFMLGMWQLLLAGAILYMLWQLTKKIDEKDSKIAGGDTDNRKPVADSGKRLGTRRTTPVREVGATQRDLQDIQA